MSGVDGCRWMSMDVDGWAEAEATGVGGWVSGRDWWMSDRPDLARVYEWYTQDA